MIAPIPVEDTDTASERILIDVQDVVAATERVGEDGGGAKVDIGVVTRSSAQSVSHVQYAITRGQSYWPVELPSKFQMGRLSTVLLPAGSVWRRCVSLVLQTDPDRRELYFGGVESRGLRGTWSGWFPRRRSRCTRQ